VRLKPREHIAQQDKPLPAVLAAARVHEALRLVHAAGADVGDLAEAHVHVDVGVEVVKGGLEVHVGGCVDVFEV
jgi:hypothetical protein